ncbi:DUF1002 domain-containing protein [Streptococcus sanguinis]|uniref:DUF1002 domain-containing protein n=1 Tax=Streptococcus sanguinis TaxID=1305 RepID=UPI00066DEBC8|nr:DUF1002 domain-containing protein [Streptococcus sanguinis]MCY7021430.1 DUF1002 domain-containing protein [Streptococcus sanguinis]RSJ40051.1 hypothetical protein D8820_06965 [Streptococcus sanguinis]
MKFKKTLMTAGALLATLFTVSTAAADSNVQKVIDETYVQPEYVLGYSLDESQKQQTLQMLGYNSSSDSKPLKTMTPEVYSKIMDVANDPSLQLYSSVKIQKLGGNKPLEVKIVTPQNITKVTEDMYRNAAVTLGVQHAQITVAAPIPVTGESALAGIYYSLEDNGATIPQENKNLAQEELAALSGINAENTGKEGYDADKLNVALADIKAAVANAKKNNSNLTADDVRKIVEETLKNYGLTQSVTSDQINLIVNFAINLSNSGVITDSDFTKTLSDLKDSIVSKAGDTFNNINLNFDANGLLQEGGNFFSNIWNAIVNFFKGLFGG